MNNSNTSDTIKLDSLTIGYKTRDGIRTVTKDINASIISGKLTCLIGTNGIGKSTLLRTLSGFQPRLGGSIVINVGDFKVSSSLLMLVFDLKIPRSENSLIVVDEPLLVSSLTKMAAVRV